MKTFKEEYIENAIKYSDAISELFKTTSEDTTYKKYMKIEKSTMKRCHEIFLILRETTQLWQIEEFMSNDDPNVQYLAAAHCLYSNPEVAEKTLEYLIESHRGHIAMKALETLKAWRKIPWTEDRYK